MWKQFKKWREKRQHLKTIQYAFRILRSLYSDLDKVTQHLLVKAIEDLRSAAKIGEMASFIMGWERGGYF